MDQENQLVIAATCGKEFINRFNRKRTKAIQILDKVFTAILDNADQTQDHLESFRFHSTDYIEDKKDNDSGSGYKVAIGKIHETLDSHEAFLNEVAADLNLSFIPKIRCINKGQGNGAKAFEMFATAAVATGITSADQVPDGHIRYTLEEEVEPTFLGKLIDGFTTTGYRLHLLASFMFISIFLGWLIVVFGYIMLSQTGNVLDFLKVILGISSIFFGLYYLINPIYQCITKRIIICPAILSPTSVPTAQLQYIATDDRRRSGRKNRQFKVKVYTSICPTCKSRIDVNNGTGPFNGRLVGLCDENPREHVFSFDYTTRLGKPL